MSGYIFGLAGAIVVRAFLRLFIWRAPRALFGWVLAEAAMGFAVMSTIALSWLAPNSVGTLLVGVVSIVGIVVFYVAAGILAPRQLSSAEKRLAEADELGVQRSLRDRNLYHATSLSIGDKS